MGVRFFVKIYEMCPRIDPQMVIITRSFPWRFVSVSSAFVGSVGATSAWLMVCSLLFTLGAMFLCVCGIFRRHRVGEMPVMLGYNVNRRSDEFLDVSKIIRFCFIAESDGIPVAASTPSSANSVNIAFRDIG